MLTPISIYSIILRLVKSDDVRGCGHAHKRCHDGRSGIRIEQVTG